MWSGSLAWTTPPLAPLDSHLHVAFVSFTASGAYGVGWSVSYLPDEEGQGDGEGGGAGDGGAMPSSHADLGGCAKEGVSSAEEKREPLLYWGQEAQVLVITEINGEDEMAKEH